MQHRNEKWAIIIFLLPATVLYFLFVIYPSIEALRMSFYNWRGLGTKEWIGFDHYKYMFVDSSFINAFLVTGKYILFLMPIVLLVSIIIALSIAKLIRTRWFNLYRAITFFPYILPAVAIAMLWATIFNPVSGMLNGILEAVGLEEWTREWLGRESTAFGSVVFVTAWQMVGFYSVLILSSILNIPEELLEAADIDGASRFQKNIYVILPMLKDILQVVLIFTLINTLKVFEMPQLMTGGGPNGSTEPISLYMYEQAFSNFNFGYASAIGVVFLILTLIASVLTLRITRGDRS
ncbi:carbohydrate ABC transporter permease [Aquisalibacillus elongatus]|uniref:Carbohydrate ABC transporter membrane protein 1 (CUT1 family) n=1 Tax=Aquisalibacillus elongatus TaxID=485577 RepID=A0A3N5BG78_9BACI|nr:sugar ABC transporter permease [Aquisalibacillus elongatus]RPF54270.1 carbohydrate ABC transporter membrane protein 1 (CUT1 family) [Aquisalibacillus elongatus]